MTGATGNIGSELIKNLLNRTDIEIVVGIRKVDKTIETSIKQVVFDFHKPELFNLSDIDRVFLLRPPNISDVDKVFKPILKKFKELNINKIVFLSVQGAEKSSIIPHNKIEKLLIELEFDHIFVRPSYFMQNLTTTLLSEIREKDRVTLPSGKAIFNWIDAQNIGEATAQLMIQFEKYKNNAYEITGSENMNYYDACKILSEEVGRKITFRSVNPLRFLLMKHFQGTKFGFAIVILVLHYLPKFQPEPKVSDNYKKLTGKEPNRLCVFIKKERSKFLN